MGLDLEEAVSPHCGEQVNDEVLRAVRERLREHVAPAHAHAAQAVVLEVAEGVDVEADQYGYDLGVRHPAPAAAFPRAGTRTEGVLDDFTLEFIAEVVCDTEYFSNFVFGNHGTCFCFRTSKLLKITEIAKQTGGFFKSPVLFFAPFLIPNSRPMPTRLRQLPARRAALNLISQSTTLTS